MPDSLPRLAFVGAGRVAGVLAPALGRAGYPVVAIASHGAVQAQALAARLPHCQATSTQESVDLADVVFLTVPDDAIARVVAGIRWRADSAVVHCSGASEIDVLNPAAAQGAQIGGFHPLQTFATPDVQLAGITVAIEASARLLETLREMAVSLGCTPLELPPGARPLYHASGAFAHNYLVTLFGQAVRLWGLLGFTEAQALAALLPLAGTSFATIESVGVAGALTGPIARGDAGTIRRHVAALEQHAPDLLPLYRELGKCALRLTSHQPGTTAELESILSPSKETSSCV